MATIKVAGAVDALGDLVWGTCATRETGSSGSGDENRRVGDVIDDCA